MNDERAQQYVMVLPWVVASQVTIRGERDTADGWLSEFFLFLLREILEL